MVIDVISCGSAVVALLKAGADPNVGDEFSSVYKVARERQLNSLQGVAFLNIWIVGNC